MLNVRNSLRIALSVHFRSDDTRGPHRVSLVVSQPLQDNQQYDVCGGPQEVERSAGALIEQATAGSTTVDAVTQGGLLGEPGGDRG